MTKFTNAKIKICQSDGGVKGTTKLTATILIDACINAFLLRGFLITFTFDRFLTHGTSITQSLRIHSPIISS